MGNYFRWFGRVLWIIGVGGSFYESFIVFQYGERPIYGMWLVASIMLGMFFIAIGEIIVLLEKNLKQNQDLYKLFENWGGENQ
jgi:hypothetical protein